MLRWLLRLLIKHCESSKSTLCQAKKQGCRFQRLCFWAAASDRLSSWGWWHTAQQPPFDDFEVLP